MLLGFDFESFYGDGYTLRTMDPPSYILDPRFEVIGCSFKEGHGPSFFVDAPDIPAYLAKLDPQETTTYAFNALFDNCILAWRYNFIPTRMYCTMRLAVALRGHLLKRGASLKEVGIALACGVKGEEILRARNLHRSDMLSDPVFWHAFQRYANNDNDMSHDILFKLLPEFPTAERRIMDRVLRCAVEPHFQVDVAMLEQHFVDLEHDKVEMLIDAGCERHTDPQQQKILCEAFAKNLRSGPKFVEVLEQHGIEVEYKPSNTDPDHMIPAFAKTDDFMARLQEHDDPEVQALVAARLGIKSTIEQTRCKRILNIATAAWPSYCDGNLPIPLKYSGAHTHRLSGDWQMNMQNLPAGRGGKKSKLRYSLKGRPGYKVVVADKSQIECRLNAWFCGQHDLVELFRRKGDPYSNLASHIFSRPVDKTTEGGVLRFIGKGGELGLGFGCGDVKFYNMVIRQARNLGMDLKPIMQFWSPDIATKSVHTYRATHGAIKAMWGQLDNILRYAWLGVGTARVGPCIIGHGYVEGPNGLRMQYGDPRMDPETGELYFTYGNRVHKIYGSKFLENIIQFLARIVTMNDALRIGDRTGHNFVLQSHDELAWIVPDSEADDMLKVALEEMRRPPSWAPTVPLDAEGKVGLTYGDAK